MKKLTESKLRKISKTFEQEEYHIPPALEYYSGVDGPTIESVYHPDNLWSILNGMETMVMYNMILEPDQKAFLEYFIGKWMREIEPYCVRLESE